MTCGYCQFSSEEEDHRCRRCGRRLSGTAVAAPPQQAREHVRLAVRALGANALAMSSVVETAARPVAVPATLKEIPMDAAAALEGSSRTRPVRTAQPSLFGAELQPKIIPFRTETAALLPESRTESRRAPAAFAQPPAQPPAPANRKPASRTVARKSATAEDPQTTLDFLPPVKTAGRTLKTSAAEAVIFCDAAVATPIHRATASALDLGMILLAFASVIAIFQTFGEPVTLDRMTILHLGAMLGLVTLLYGLVFATFGEVTPGMRWTHLRLITFDGFALDQRARALRFLGSWMSVLSGGLGILWALLDEENLTWHDHMSKTFPALRESNSRVVRQSRR